MNLSSLERLTFLRRGPLILFWVKFEFFAFLIAAVIPFSYQIIKRGNVDFFLYSNDVLFKLPLLITPSGVLPSLWCIIHCGFIFFVLCLHAKWFINCTSFLWKHHFFFHFITCVLRFRRCHVVCVSVLKRPQRSVLLFAFYRQFPI